MLISAMLVTFERLHDILRVDVRYRETAEEARRLARLVLAERARLGVLGVLVNARESRPIFKVEEYGLSGILAQVAAIPGLRIASVSDDDPLYASEQYVELLARQRNVALRAFRTERDALVWLRTPRTLAARAAGSGIRTAMRRACGRES